MKAILRALFGDRATIGVVAGAVVVAVVVTRLGDPRAAVWLMTAALVIGVWWLAQR